MTIVFLLLAMLNMHWIASPQNETRVACGQSAAEQGPLLREAIHERYTLRRIEFTGNETIRDYELRQRVLLREGDIFSQRNLDKSLESLNKLRTLYPLTRRDVIVKLDTREKLVDVTFCFRERHSRRKDAS